MDMFEGGEDIIQPTIAIIIFMGLLTKHNSTTQEI